MKKLVLLAVLVSTTFANAYIMPERSIAKATMAVLNTEGARFSLSKEAVLDLQKHNMSDDPTKIVLFIYYKSEMEHPLMPEIVEFEIYGGGIDLCGSTHYMAKKAVPRPIPMHRNQERYTIELIDHTTRKCKDLRPHIWEAKIRYGEGWCGTMDSTLDLGGDPVYAIDTDV